MSSRRLLILSDGKPGHVNQSIAFARHLGRDYALAQVRFNSRRAKALSYLYDRFGFLTTGLFSTEAFKGGFSAVVSAGSETYYANRVLADRWQTKSVAIMLPKGYRYQFDLIVAQQHDDPPRQDNILSIPVNLSFVEPQGLVGPGQDRKVVALIIGGDSRHAKLDPAQLRDQLKLIIPLFPDHEFWMTTSRRTSPEIEKVLKEFRFAYAVYFSEQQINPIPDFLQHSDYVFLTADSTSMVSEAVSYGTAHVEILPLAQPLAGDSKIARFFQILQREDCLHLFDGQLGRSESKIDLSHALKDVAL